ncbi:MAG: hypothetical protein HKN68_06725 [Saprospiraceae bacterium]|nr:hypothetical protein [Saprospiraceae bacterium]
MHPDISYLGEIKKMNDSYLNRYCSCGKKAEVCEFWGPIIQRNRGVFSRKEPSDAAWYRLISTWKAIFKISNSKIISDDGRLISDIHNVLSDTKQGEQIILDSSKSLKRYVNLSQISDIEVYPILIERDLRSNLASFVKRGMGFISSYLRIVVNLKMITRYLSRHNIPYFRVRYEVFATNPDKMRTQVLNFVGLGDDVHYEQTIDAFHLLSGSPNTIEGFKKSQTIKIHNEQKDPFTKIQQRLLKLMGL